MSLKVTNNAFGTLNAGISNSDVTIVLEAGQGARFPVLGAGDYFYATLIDTSNNLEIVKVTARATDTMTVVRAQDGTSARAYNVNDRFELRPTAALFNEKADAEDVTAELATKVNKAGDTMTGTLTTTGEQLRVNRPDANMARLTLQNTNRHWTVSNYGTQFGPNGSFNIADETAAAVRFSIDTAGRVTTPFQPAFLARGSKSHAGSWRVVSDGLTTIEHNIGGHFNSGTGRFTAPIAGRYAFYAGGYLESQALNERHGIAVPINAGARPMITGGGAPAVDTPMSAHFIIRNLAAGDFVTLDVFLPTARSIGTGAHELWFGGHLIS